MSQLELFQRFGVALAVGLLIGLQRESAHRDDDHDTLLFGGVRTFPLLALVGASGAHLAVIYSSVWLLAVPLSLAGALVVAVYVVTAWRGEVGMTTEAAALVTLLAGAFCGLGEIHLAVVLGVVVMGLLSLRVKLHALAGRVTREDLEATFKFAVVTTIVLPILPNTSYGGPPFDVLNPYKIWWMVVLISGLSFLGYLLIKMVGTRRGISLTGLLGGLVSSTAVTLSFSQRSREQTKLARAFAGAVTIAWTTMFLRVLVEVAVVNRLLLDRLWLPMTAAAVAGLGAALLLHHTGPEQETPSFRNPFELGKAIRFGLLYAVVLLFCRAAQTWYGDGGVYLSAILAGLTDVDAVTLSVAELSQAGGSIDPLLATRAITLAAMANTLVKAGIVAFTGGRELRRTMLPVSLTIAAVGLAAAFFGF